MLDKTYRPAEVEQTIYSQWENSGAFAADPASSRPPYCVMIPPPNVTGSLHMGHALNSTLQDILIRRKRMQGFDALWQPGMDHAGIATQMVVERQLEAEGKTRHDLGRDKFIEKVWRWKAQSGGAITGQLRRLGSSCDWSRERFTMDEGLSEAVRKVFVDLHKQGLIYRDKRLVNWDPLLHTAISDLEVEQRETLGRMWHFKYPVEGEPGTFVTVATTRPETMLGDTAVAVHPDDERYKDLVGKNCVLPIAGRLIPIVTDDYADPEKGSGAVKITPAHDFNDFEVGKRHDLEMINVLDRDARMNENTPERYHGVDRYEARDAIVKEMEGLGLLDKIDENQMVVPYGDRSGVVIEPWLTDQWFVDAKTLAKPAVEAVKSGRIKFVPGNWAKTYFEWMNNIQQWCVSRQIWWGHQIPAWYGPDGEIFVELTEEEALAAAEKHYGQKTELKRDLAYLMRLWKDMEIRRTKGGNKPRLLYSESDLLVRSLRDLVGSDIKQIIIDDESAITRAVQFMKIVAPRSSAKVMRYTGGEPIYHAFGIEQQLTLTHAREVPLPSGGRLVIDETEAVIAIDVNSGKSRSARDAETNAYNTNVEAVEHVVHLRSSDILLGILPFFHSFGYMVTLWAPLSLDVHCVYHFTPLDAKQVGKLSRRWCGKNADDPGRGIR